MIALFPNDPKFVAQNWAPIDKDPSMWDTFITNTVRKLLQNENVDISVIWNIKDDSKGYGVGSALIVNRYNKQKFIIPVIIKDFRLAPMDVLITDRHAMRLTNDNAKDLLFSGSLGSGVVSKAEMGLISNPGIDADGLGGQGYNGLPRIFDSYDYVQTAQKSSSVSLIDAYLHQNYAPLAEQKEMDVTLLGTLQGSVTKEAADNARRSINRPEILNKYADEKHIFVEYVNSPVLEVIKDKKDHVWSNMLSSEDSGSNPDYKKIEAVKKIGPNAYVMMSSSIMNFEPQIDITSGGNLRLTLQNNNLDDNVVDAVMEAVESTGSRGAVIPYEKNNDMSKMLIYSDTPENQTKPSETGIYRAFKQDGTAATGVFFSKRLNLKCDEVDANLFITRHGGGEQNTDFKAIPTRETMTTWNDDILNVNNFPSVGLRGGFVSGYTFLGPVWVQSTERDSSFDPISFVVNDGINIAKITFDTYQNNVVFREKPYGSSIPIISLPGQKFKWVTINESIIYGDKPLEKTAQVIYEGNDKYTLRNFNDIPNRWATLLPEAETKYALAAQGFTIENIYTILDLAEKAGACKISNPPKKPKPEVQKKANIKIPNMSKYDLIKVASVFDSMDTVDKVLGLNFINPSNIARFASVLPQLKDTREELVRLLIVCRIGLTEVPEPAITQALDALDEIISGLRQLELANDAA